MPTPAAAAPAVAPSAAEADVAPTPRFGKKRLLLIGIALALLLVVGVGTAALVLKQRAAQRADAAEAADATTAPKPNPKRVPVFVALEMFTVNLADREAERYAQIGVTLELVDEKATDRIKSYLPAIRNNILMVLAHKTSHELLLREGKEKLAAEIRREAVRPLGYEIGDGARAADPDDPPPVRRVHFANFIIQ